MAEWKEFLTNTKKSLLEFLKDSLEETKSSSVYSSQNNYLLVLIGFISLFPEDGLRYFVKKIDENCYKFVIIFYYEYLDQSVLYKLKADDFKKTRLDAEEIIYTSFFYYEAGGGKTISCLL